MALTRKSLAAMGIEPEKIDQIVEEHSKTVTEIREQKDALATEVDKLKADAKKVEDLEKQLAAKTKELEAIDVEGMEKKYNDLKSEYDSFKSDTEAKATHAKKQDAYRNLLKEAGVSEKRIDSVIKVSDVDSIKLDKDGKIEDAEKLTESVKSEWADFIVTKGEQGAKVSKPPANDGDGGKQPSRAALMTAQYRNEHYGNPKED